MMPRSEQAELITSLLKHRGWVEVMEPGFKEKQDQVKDQFILAPKERPAEFADWSHDKLAGMALGLGWARQVFRIWLQNYNDALLAAEREREAMAQVESGVGHPFAPEPSVDAL